MPFTDPNRRLTRTGGRTRYNSTMTVQRFTEWIDWYRFARAAFDYGHDEAVAYANARYVEELNRQTLHRRAA
jgi:hypothetical protein